MREYRKALEIVPDAESATIALASLQFMQDDRDAAVSLIDRVFNRAARPDDPGPLDRLRQFPPLAGAEGRDARCTFCVPAVPK